MSVSLAAANDALITLSAGERATPRSASSSEKGARSKHEWPLGFSGLGHVVIGISEMPNANAKENAHHAHNFHLTTIFTTCQRYSNT